MNYLQKVQAAIKRFYYEHHDKIKMENELHTEVLNAKVEGFTETKRKVVEALDYRIARTQESLEVLNRKEEKVQSVIDDMESRVDELETFRNYVKGMVIKADG